jgi:hypothetical protein
LLVPPLEALARGEEGDKRDEHEVSAMHWSILPRWFQWRFTSPVMVNEARMVSSSRRRHPAAALRGLALALALLPSLGAALPARMAEALRYYEAGHYQGVLQVLEPAAGDGEAGDAERLLLLGKAYGRLAQQAPWYRAVALAARCGEYLERAVAADPDHREALRDLASFLEEAPVLLGGDAERARALRARLARLESAAPEPGARGAARPAGLAAGVVIQ